MDPQETADAFKDSERKIRKCFADVAALLSDADPEFAREWARELFRDFVQKIKLPQKHDRAKPKRERDAKLLADYTAAAKRPARVAVLQAFADKHKLGVRKKLRAGASDRSSGLEIATRIMQRARRREKEKSKEREAKCRFRRKPATYSDLIAATLPI